MEIQTPTMSDPAPAPAATVPQEEPIPYIDYPLIPVSESDSSDNDDFGGNLRAPPADASLIFGWPGSKSYRPNNRGNKLKRRALEPENALPRPRPALWANRVDESMQVGRPNGQSWGTADALPAVYDFGHETKSDCEPQFPVHGP